MNRTLEHSDLLRLKRWNTPTIYNGWEQITKHDRRVWVNQEKTVDFMPQMGPMIGYAVTVVCEPSNPEHQKKSDAVARYREYVASVPGPKIVVLQDLDKPRVIGSFWGEVNANVHRALGCVGTITDGAIRDLDEMNNAGFKALARRMCVGHAYSCPVEWNVEVDVFGNRIAPGQLIHADKHGFLVVPDDDHERLLEAAEFMDANECRTVIAAARNATGKASEQMLREFGEAGKAFKEAVRDKFGAEGGGEW